jgi:Transposase DDE domain
VSARPLARIHQRPPVPTAHRVCVAALPASGRYPLPHDFTVSWSAAHKHFLRWCRATTGPRCSPRYAARFATRSGRRRRPTVAVVDSSSVKASPVAGPRGFDGAKKVDGVKRHVLVDSAGILVAAVVTPATTQDGAAFRKLLRSAKRIPTIAHIWVDKGYTGALSPTPPPRPVSPLRSCPGRNPAAGSSSSRDAGWSNAPTDGSTTAAA